MVAKWDQPVADSDEVSAGKTDINGPSVRPTSAENPQLVRAYVPRQSVQTRRDFGARTHSLALVE
jgi:hypothetical protein